jgi:hypothetical protein
VIRRKFPNRSRNHVQDSGRCFTMRLVCFQDVQTSSKSLPRSTACHEMPRVMVMQIKHVNNTGPIDMAEVADGLCYWQNGGDAFWQRRLRWDCRYASPRRRMPK